MVLLVTVRVPRSCMTRRRRTCRAIPRDGAVGHGEGAEVVHAAAADRRVIPRDGAVGHGEGAVDVVHAAAVATARIARDGAVGHGERAAVVHTPPPKRAELPEMVLSVR